MFFSLKLAKCKKHLAELNKRKNQLISEDDSRATPGSELYSVIQEIDDYIEGQYAHEVFNYYQKRKPLLIRTQTSEEYTWEKAFGQSFEEVPKSLRHSLVGLVEGGGRFQIK